MRTALVLALLAACGSSRPPPDRTTGADPTGSLPGVTPNAPAARAPIVVDRVVVSLSRPSGTSKTTIHPDGKVETALFVLQNGRGPKVDASFTLAPDGTITAMTAAGKHEMGTKVAERFTLAGGRAKWKSEEEAGDRPVTGKVFFFPIAPIPEVLGWLVPAALANGGTIAVLPSGEAKVAIAGDRVEVKRGNESRVLTCYAISGLDFAPKYTWMNQDGTWFGTASEWFSVVPAGWESSINTLVEHQRKVERERDAERARTLAHKPPAAGLAFTHARVLDVVRGKWLADHTVVVVGDKITAVGPSKTVKIPKGAEVIDLGGKALIPGLVDMHEHHDAEGGILDIASGVTTGRDVGNDPDKLDDLKARYDSGAGIGPHLVRMGFIEGRGEKAASSTVTAETVEEARAAVEYYAKRGYEGIKIYNSVKPELVKVLADLAHAKGMQVTGHIPVHMLAHEAVAAGYDGIEHINMLFLNFFATHETDTRDTTRFTLVGDRAASFDLGGERVRELIDLLVRRKIVIDPTVGVFETLFMGKPGVIVPGFEPTFARMPILTQRLYLVGGLPLGDKAGLYAKSYAKMLALVKRLHERGVPVVLGTDSVAGLMLHHEMALFVRAGIKPADVLRLATIGSARAMKQDKRFGSITKGKRADLVVVDGDPLADITALRHVRTTMRGGVMYESDQLYPLVGVKPAN